MSWTELITLILMDFWRTATGRNRPRDIDPGDLFDEEAPDEEEDDPRSIR
ncbi:MAG: hypothetical protein ABIH26_00415 [Candidatus Eisenbacteria bacterium]